MERLKQFFNKYVIILNILILVANLLILSASTYNLFQTSRNITTLSSEITIQRISLNLKISSDWQALWWYMEKTIHKGMPREQVLKELDKAGPYVIKSVESEDYPFCEGIEFQGLGKQTHYPMWFCYQDNEVKTLENFGTAIDD
jgi:hypothetical protein